MLVSHLIFALFNWQSYTFYFNSLRISVLAIPRKQKTGNQLNGTLNSLDFLLFGTVMIFQD